MVNWSDGFITLNGMKIHYYRTGGDKPALVLSHGAGDDGLCWARIARELEKDYDVIMPDARGHGKSDSGRGDYSSASRAADLAGLIHALNLDRPIAGGHSLGADASLYLAADYPGLARAIFMEDPPIILPDEPFGDGKMVKNASDAQKLITRFLWAFKLLPRFAGRWLGRNLLHISPEDELLYWEEAKKRVNPDFIRSISTMADSFLVDPLDVFRKITVPALLITGDKTKGSIVSQSAAQRCAQASSLVQVVYLEGASHDIHRTRFDGYLLALRKFLSSM